MVLFGSHPSCPINRAPESAWKSVQLHWILTASAHPSAVLHHKQINYHHFCCKAFNVTARHMDLCEFITACSLHAVLFPVSVPVRNSEWESLWCPSLLGDGFVAFPRGWTSNWEMAWAWPADRVTFPSADPGCCGLLEASGRISLCCSALT